MSSELTESQAVSLIERRRMQNRLSQQRYRDRARLAKRQGGLSPNQFVGRASTSKISTVHPNINDGSSGVPWSATMLLMDPQDESPTASTCSYASDSGLSTDASAGSSAGTTSLSSDDTSSTTSTTLPMLDRSSQKGEGKSVGTLVAAAKKQSNASEPFYLHLSRMLMDPAEIDDTQTIVPPPTLDLALTMRARAAVDLVPTMSEAFGIPLELMTDKKAMIEPSYPWWPPPSSNGNDSGLQQLSNEGGGGVARGEGNVVVYYTSSKGEGLLRLNWEGKPSNMTPTWLQRNRRHQIGLSVIFPWPSVRDRMIEEVEKQNMQGTICQDLAYGGSGEDNPDDEWQPSFTIWGEDLFDPLSWEVGKAFLLKYPHMFDAQVLAQTNWWRRKRGKDPIVP